MAAAPKLYYYAKRRGEAEAIRLLFKELGQVLLLVFLAACSWVFDHGIAALYVCVQMQAFEDVAVDDALLKELRDAGYLLFNDLPMVQWGDFRLVECTAAVACIGWSHGQCMLRRVDLVLCLSRVC